MHHKSDVRRRPGRGPSGVGLRIWPLRRQSVAVVLAAGLVVLAVGLICTAVYPSLRGSVRVRHTDVNPYGANFFLEREVEAWKREKTLAMARAAGIVWMRQEFPWAEIEPEPGRFEWAKYDRLVDLASRYGMQIIARLDRAPAWTHPGNPFASAPPDDPATYRAFVRTFVARYGHKVAAVQLWNEPNLAAEWGFEPVDPASYARLLQAGYSGAREGHRETLVLSAPLATTLEDVSLRGNMNELLFLEQMYQAGAGASFDILSANAFGLERPPEDPPDPNVLNFRRVELLRRVMEHYGDGRKAIWISEYGWNAPPAAMPRELLTWGRVTPQQQAEYTVRGIAWAREHWPWLGAVCIWYFRQVGDMPPDQPVYYFALVDPEFRPQPVYEALRGRSAP